MKPKYRGPENLKKFLDTTTERERETTPDTRVAADMLPLEVTDEDERVNKKDTVKAKNIFNPGRRKVSLDDEVLVAEHSMEEQKSFDDEILEKIDAEREGEKTGKKEKVNDGWIRPGARAIIKGDKAVYDIKDINLDDSQALLFNAITKEEEWADFSQLKRGPESWRAEEKKEKIIDNSEGKSILDKVRRIIGR